MIAWPAYTASGLFGSLVALVARIAWKNIQRDRELLFQIHEELAKQRTNCLTTLQCQGETQIELLNKISDNLSYIKGFVEGQH